MLYRGQLDLQVFAVDETEVIAVFDAIEAQLFPGDDGQLVHQGALGNVCRGKVAQKLLLQLFKSSKQVSYYWLSIAFVFFTRRYIRFFRFCFFFIRNQTILCCSYILTSTFTQ